MATDLTTLKGQVYRILGDPDGEATDADQLFDGIRAAYVAILPWVPKMKVSTISAGVTSSTLPADLYQVDALVDQTEGIVYPRTVFRAEALVGEASRLANSWHDLPNNTITFARELANPCDLIYVAYWTAPTITDEDETALEIPDRAVWPVALYTASVVLLSQAVSASELRQYNTRVDSGNPEHNPVEESVKFLLTLFKQELTRHFSYQRAQQ